MMFTHCNINLSFSHELISFALLEVQRLIAKRNINVIIHQFIN